MDLKSKIRVWKKNSILKKERLYILHYYFFLIILFDRIKNGSIQTVDKNSNESMKLISTLEQIVNAVKSKKSVYSQNQDFNQKSNSNSPEIKSIFNSNDLIINSNVQQ